MLSFLIRFIHLDEKDSGFHLPRLSRLPMDDTVRTVGRMHSHPPCRAGLPVIMMNYFMT